MDIHRCRFVAYPPHAINALAFSKPSDPRRRCPPDQRLAIGRANGEIEIWNPAGGAWVQETTFPGGMERSVEGLTWTQDLDDEDEEEGNRGETEAEKESDDDEIEGRRAGRLRLFSAGFSSVVTEWDLAQGVPLRHANGNFGAIWCLAAQPRWTRPNKGGVGAQGDANHAIRHDQYLAAGCEDGTIVLFSTEDGNLRYLRTIGKPPSKRPRILSLTWQDRSTIVAGYSDSHIRVYDIRSRANVRNMSLGKPATGGNETLVWAVKCLPNGTILSGDSAGDLKIWDGKNYSLMQRIQGHQADILDITTNANGSMIITGGADRRTVAYKLAGRGKAGKVGRWAQVMHRRFHEHDVKSLASFESRELSFTVSGGLDTAPVVLPLRGWHQEYHRTLSHLPRSPPVSSAPQARLFISWWERQVSVWHLPPHVPFSSGLESPAAYAESHALVAKIMLNGEENITSADISDDGNHLAVTTVSSVRIFRLRLRRNPSDGRIGVRTKKLEIPAPIERSGGRHVAFSPDSHWLCLVRLNNEVVLVRTEIASDDKKQPSFNKHVIRLNRSDLHASSGRRSSGLHGYLRTINSVSFSADSRMLAVGDLSGSIAAWVLEGAEGSSNGLVNGVTNLDCGIPSAKSPDSSASDNDDDESSSDEDDSIRIHGQRWRKNPAGAYLPQLDAPLLAIAFRCSTPEGRRKEAQVHVGSHPTRKTPHPHAKDLPSGEDRLIAITSEHKIVEFCVLSGKLSDWSRRNPVSFLPEKFRAIKERAMGLIWDVSNLHERLWIYGTTWMLMLDLSQDLPSPSPRLEQEQEQANSLQNRKRKWGDFEAAGMRKKGSGAGGPMPVSESYVGVARHIRKFKSSQPDESWLISLEDNARSANVDGEEEEEEEEEEEKPTTALAHLRRGLAKLIGGDSSSTNGPAEAPKPAITTGEKDAPQPDTVQVHDSKGPSSLLSVNYRSILGIVRIGTPPGGGDSATDAASGVEVAIIERPRWDVELPPRFDGGQDWEA